jgi:hypothetical protein
MIKGDYLQGCTPKIAQFFRISTWSLGALSSIESWPKAKNIWSCISTPPYVFMVNGKVVTVLN